MNMQQIEFIKFRDFRHAGGERQIVGRVIKERVTGDLDLVIVDVRLRLRKPNGLSVGNEMDIVPAMGQLQAQFRGHHAAASVSGIAGDPDLHRSLPDAADIDGRGTRAIQILRWCLDVYGLTKCQEARIDLL